MRLSKLGLFCLFGLLFIATVIIGMLFLVDPDVFRGQVEMRATNAFGRPFRIGGPIGLERSLRPKIILQDITIDNPDWAVGQHLARADQVAVRVALLPLLGGQLRVIDVTFTGVEIDIEDGRGGANNYSFDEEEGRDAVWQPPSIENMQAKDVVISYHSAAGLQRRFEIARARMWNIPGEPERIEAEGVIQGVQYALKFRAEPDADLAGPGNPWSLKLNMQGGGLSVALEGQMAQAFAWRQFDGRVVVHGEKTDELARLLRVERPPTGSLALQGRLRSDQGAIELSAIKGRIGEVLGRHDIEIVDGEVLAGDEAPFRLSLQGSLDDLPLRLNMASAEGTAPDAPRPITATLTLADTDLDVQGAMAVAAGDQPTFTLDGRLQGRSLDTLARLLDRDPPATGAFRFAFHADIGANRFRFDRVAGEIEDVGQWDTLRIEKGRLALHADGSLDAAATVDPHGVPLTLSASGGPEVSDASGRSTRPLEIEARVPGSTMTAKGTIVTRDQRSRLEMAANLQGDRPDRLGTFLGITLPPITSYAVRTDLVSEDGIHSLQDFDLRLGADRVSGQLQWEDRAPQPSLTGRLTARRLSIKALTAASAPTTASDEAPIDLRWLRSFDARVEIAIDDLIDDPIPVKNIEAALTVADGRLSAPFRARVAGAPCEGQLDLNQPGQTPQLALRGSTGRIDVGPMIKPMKRFDAINGRIETVQFEGRSSGRTLPALLERAALKATLRPADLRYEGQFAGRPLNLVIAAAEIETEAGAPLSATLTGTFQGVPFDATASTAPLGKLGSERKPLPIQVELKTADTRFSGRGTVARPLEKGVFDLEHDIAGDEIEGLDPLIDLALPLQGAFHARGTIAGRGERLTYVEDLRVGKSDFQMTLDVWHRSPRPEIRASVSSETVYLEDVKLIAGSDPPQAEGGRRYLIPEYRLPVAYMRAVDLTIDARARRVLTDMDDIGDLSLVVTLTNGHFKSMATISKPEGAQIRKFVDVNAGYDPPRNQLEIKADNIDYDFLTRFVPATALREGALDFGLQLSGTGYTRRQFLEQADGTLTIVGGPGRLSERRIDLWAADLIPTLFSPRWQREETVELNCMVAHIGVTDGLATIKDVLLDTRRVMIAAAGVINLKNEELDVYIAPRPKRASLVSLANPVRVTGTLSQPAVAVARLPGRSQRRLARTGILAGLVNPLFLLTALSDTGTLGADSCAAAIENIEASSTDPPP